MIVDKAIAVGLILLSAYMISHAVLLPIGWNGESGGPGGGAFPFWCSLITLVCAVFILFRKKPDVDFSFDPEMIGSIIKIVISVAITIVAIPVTGAYIALPLFMFWYIRIHGRHGWGVSLAISLIAPIAIFFFFEATLKILLPKGVTEPFFFPLYATFF